MKKTIRKKTKPLAAAQEAHAIAERCGHDLIWRETPDGYEGRCNNHNCRLLLTIEADGRKNLTNKKKLERDLPSCPFNTEK